MTGYTFAVAGEQAIWFVCILVSMHFSYCDHSFSLFSIGQGGKPRRQCPLCRQSKADLKRHILEFHRHHDRIKPILEQEKSGLLSRKDILAQIDLLRKEGVQQQNKTILAEGGGGDDFVYMQKSSGMKSICSKCRGTYKNKYFRVHQKYCPARKGDDTPAVATKLEKAETNHSQDWQGVVHMMDKDEIFDIIKADDLIQLIGKNIYERKKTNKKKEAKVKARAAMRRLGKLVKVTEDVKMCKELFEVQNFYKVEEGIKKMCSTGEELKAGLNIAH